jgi:hypothetical protein
MKLLFRLVQNKRLSKGIFWAIAVVSMMSTNLPPSLDWVRYAILVIAIIWALIYHYIPKQESAEEVKQRQIGSIFILAIVIIISFLLK